jgi:bacteriocin-like protein
MRKLGNMTPHTGMSDEPSALTEKELEAVTGGAVDRFANIGDIKGESTDDDSTVGVRYFVGVRKL